MKQVRLNPIKLAAVVIFLFAVLYFTVLVCVSAFSLKVTGYEFESPKVEAPIKIIQLTDLHAKSFGRGNKRLIETVANESPDLIFITGDMYSDDDNGYEKTLRLIGDLKGIAPVYYSLGNHEELYIWKYGKDCLQEIRDAGATLMEKNIVNVDVNGTRVRIGGTIGYALSVDFWELNFGKNAYEHYFDESFAEQRYMKQFEKTDALKLLLLHRPEGPTLWAKDGWYDVDFVFTGHTHGGIVRIPHIGGLVSPEEGFFPKYDYGLYTMNGVNTIISSGLGNSAIVPRINNIPEIVSVTIN